MLENGLSDTVARISDYSFNFIWYQGLHSLCRQASLGDKMVKKSRRFNFAMNHERYDDRL